MTTNTNDLFVIGKVGERVIAPITFIPNMPCWRSKDDIRCTRMHSEQYLAGQGEKIDADICVKCNCTGCKYVPDGEEQQKEIIHEIKTNVATYDENTKVGRNNRQINRTQNIYIEFIQNIDAYKKQKLTEQDDAFSENGKLEYIEGIGWYNKREKAYAEGKTKFNHADWYHMYLPYDIYEKTGIPRKSTEPEYLSASDEVIQKWNADTSISNDAYLITQMPVAICISISDSRLEELVKTYKGIREYRVEEAGYLKGVKIPVSQIIPCIEPNIGYNYMYMDELRTDIKVSIVAEFIKKGRTKRILSVLPVERAYNRLEDNSREELPEEMRLLSKIYAMDEEDLIEDDKSSIIVYPELYVPEEIFGKKTEYGYILEGLKKFDKYMFRTDIFEYGIARWIPKAILDFEVTRLRVYQ